MSISTSDFNSITTISLKHQDIWRINSKLIQQNIQCKKNYIIISKQDNLIFKNISPDYEIIFEEDILDINIVKNFKIPRRPTWYYQQLLKIKFAEMLNENFIIIDADSVPIRKISYLSGDKINIVVGGTVYPKYINYIKKIFPNLNVHKDSFTNEFLPFKIEWLRLFLNQIKKTTQDDYIYFLLKNISVHNSEIMSDMNEQELLMNFAYNYFFNEIILSDLKILRPVNKFIFMPEHINYFKDYLALEYSFLGYR